MTRNAAIGLAAFLAGLFSAYLWLHSVTTQPEVPIDQVNMRFDALDEAVAALDRALHSTASGSDAGVPGPTQTSQVGDALQQEIALMREELRGILEALGPSHELSPAAEGRQSPHESTAIFEAQQRSWDVLNRALEAKRWTQEDARDLFAWWNKLPLGERQRLLGTLFAAANRGEIEMEGTRVLF